MSIVKRVLQAVEVDHAGHDATYLVNKDLLPVPPKYRLWSAVNFVTFWIADAANLSTFMIASSMVGAGGMTWWQAWLAVWVGYGVSACFLVLNAVPGARYHIIFPAYARASFGIYGAVWPTLNRAFCAIIWYGVQAWIGGEAVYILLRSIWPSYANIPNRIPSSGTDTAHFVSFFLFSFFSLIAIWFPMHSIRHLFTVKAILTPAAAIALLVWCLVKANGAGELLRAPATSSGSKLGWSFVSNLMSCIANMATLIVNAVDFASRASKPRDVVVPQLIAMPTMFALTSLVGILIASSSEVIFGEFVWSPLDVMNGFLDNHGNSGTRAGCAFISIGFIIAQLGTNISANSLSAGCDTTALLPRFITIRRGGYLAALVGFCICPWQLASGSNQFGNYLSAYSVFLSSIAGVLICHYYAVAGQKVKVADLYTVEKEGVYHYWKGINLRAFGAYIAGLLINVVGFAGAVGNDVPLAATRIYQLSFFTGFGVAFVVYYALCKIFPIPVITEEEIDEVPAVVAETSSFKRSTSYGADLEEKKIVEGDVDVRSVAQV
ncbi:hypothetical protein JCM8547_007419 [Rhodosporidiobolus lusitaniae]